MAKKQKSFAEKASSKGAKDLVHVKFVKSVPSERDGFWRFNESMISMEKGQNLDTKLKEIEDEARLVDIDMPSENDEQTDSDLFEAESSSTVEAPAEDVAEEAPAEEDAEEAPAEEAAEEVAEYLSVPVLMVEVHPTHERLEVGVVHLNEIR